MFGDHHQLGTIKDYPLWTDPTVLDNQKRSFAAEGIRAFRRLTHVFNLYKALRQRKDFELTRFLTCVRHKDVDKYAFSTLKKRFEGNLCSIERAQFKDAVHLYSSRADTHTFNM